MKELNTYRNLWPDVYDLSKPETDKNEYEFYRSCSLKADGKL